MLVLGCILGLGLELNELSCINAQWYRSHLVGVSYAFRAHRFTETLTLTRERREFDCFVAREGADIGSHTQRQRSRGHCRGYRQPQRA